MGSVSCRRVDGGRCTTVRTSVRTSCSRRGDVYRGWIVELGIIIADVDVVVVVVVRTKRRRAMLVPSLVPSLAIAAANDDAAAAADDDVPRMTLPPVLLLLLADNFRLQCRGVRSLPILKRCSDVVVVVNN